MKKKKRPIKQEKKEKEVSREKVTPFEITQSFAKGSYFNRTEI